MLFEEARTRRLGARGRLLCTTTAALALPFLPVFAQDGTKQARADERARARQDVRQDVEQARRAELELVQQQQALERERQALEEARARAEWDLLNRVANGEESATSEEWTDWVNLVQQDQERKQLGNQIDEQLLESNAKTVVPDDEVRRALSRSGELLRAAGDLAAAEALERFLAELEAQSQWNEQMRRQREDLLAERRARAEIEGQLVRDRIERLAEMQRARGASRTQETLRALGYVESNSSPAEGKSDLEGRIGQLEEKVDQLSTLLRALIDRNTEGSPGSIR